MLDFLRISVAPSKKGSVEIVPKFIVKRSEDLMIRGGDFYAVWDDEAGLWSTDEQDVIRLVDAALDIRFEEYKREHPDTTDAVSVRYLWDSDTGSIDKWHKYCQKQMRDNYHMLDETIIFSNQETCKEDYASKRLPYPLAAGDCPSYEKLISTLYSPTERAKLEWAIGAIVSGDSKHIQKFMVLYGAAGTGKSTILNIIQQLFNGYCSVFDAKALGSSSNSFALEAFKSNPLVAIQHDGDLSHIEDNTRLNSLVSHESMTVNEKFKSTYTNNFKAFLFMGTNKPVKITDSKSGLIRRLIDVTPSGKKLSSKDYRTAMGRIPFELGAIADHCLKVYSAEPDKYDSYIPVEMLGASNDFYNYVVDSYSIFEKENGVSLKIAWEMYKAYCDEAKVPYPYSKRIFKEELKNYFETYSDSMSADSSKRNYFSGFKKDKFVTGLAQTPSTATTIEFATQNSIFDQVFCNEPAQYANENETPSKRWDDISTKLSDLDTSRLHYVRVPANHIVIDFDLKNADGEKDFSLNLAEASKWPKTYSELSKSGRGIHLHYNYDGDVSKLSSVYSPNIEVKVFGGKSALRRKLTKCNAEPIATINSGLPLKTEKKMIEPTAVADEKRLRNLIKKCLGKRVHPNTKSNVDFIFKLLDDAHKSGMRYDVSDLYSDIYAFAAMSTHQSEYCISLVNKMPFKSEDDETEESPAETPMVFYDVEVFPNLFLVNWKVAGKDKVARLINPKPSDIEDLIKYRLVGFNCRRYDNHILYACMLGYTNQQLYELSQRIVSGDRTAFFGEAYNLSYTDVYDFCSVKQSLKKWEIALHIHHQELGLPWDQPVPEERWEEVAEYCDNDVISTEAVFNARHEDFAARTMLARLAKGCVNDTTNSLSTKIIFGNDRHPQDQFNYRFMGDVPEDARPLVIKDGVVYHEYGDEQYVIFDSAGRPVFPGYTYDFGKSTYRGEEVGEGGYVYSEPGMYSNVALLDVASMHPSSIIAEQLFGPVYTKRFADIKSARVAIKHKDYASARLMLDGALNETIDEIEAGELDPSALAGALKIVINSVYGLTAAKFDNPFRDIRNKDNIVAKRGALFMVNLKHEVQERGFTVAHIKTDSIKIPGATPEIINFVMEFGKQYGYTFEHEATYSKMCLVNDAVYIARYDTEDECLKRYGYIPSDIKKHGGDWCATGAQFQVPYVYKTLFSKEAVDFDDLCEAKSVKTAMYLDMNEKLGEDEHNRIFVGKVGLFCPMKPGAGGGILVRENADKDGNIKYDSVVGTKGYRWLEAEQVKTLGKQDDICLDYYRHLVDDAKENIQQYGDLEWLVA